MNYKEQEKMPNRISVLMILLVLITITLFVVALRSGKKITVRTGLVDQPSCEAYGDFPANKLPVRCLEYYHIHEVGR